MIGKWWHDGEGSRVSSYDANWSNQKSPTPGNVSTTDRGERLLSLLSGKRKHHIKRWTKYRRIPRYSSFPCPTVWNWPTFLFVAFSFLCSFHRTSVLNFLTPTSQTGWGCYLDSSPWLFFSGVTVSFGWHETFYLPTARTDPSDHNLTTWVTVPSLIDLMKVNRTRRPAKSASLNSHSVYYSNVHWQSKTLGGKKSG